MIRPEPRDDESQKRKVAALSTVGIVALASVMVAFIGIPDLSNTRESFRRLDPQLIAEARPDPKPEPEEQKSEEETEEEETPDEAQEDAKPQKAPERVKAPDLSSEGLNVDPSPTQTSNQASSDATEKKSSGGNTSVEVEREKVGEVGGAQTFDDPEASALPSGENNQATSGSEGSGIAIKEGSGSGQGSASGDDFGGGGKIAAGKGQAGGENSGAAVEVSLKDLDQKNYSNLDVKRLIKWMENHPGDLPSAVDRLIGNQDYLTSKTPIQVGGRRYGLYLMCKKSLYEVHIVLVQGNRAQYLVDRSFQKQSRKFRVGTVRRDGQGQIAAIMSRGKARGEESKRFYDIFLSWWEKAKKDVEG